MPAYVFAGNTVTDIALMGEYAKLVPATLEPFDGKFVVRGGQCEGVEGQSRPRNIVVEFPSYQTALDCYRSEAYQKARQIRLPVSTLDLVIVEGPPDT